MPTSSSSIATLISTILLTGCGTAEVYQNPEYGFSAVIPPGGARCAHDLREHDTGFTVVRDGQPGDQCYGLETRPHLSLSASYNVLDETPEQAIAPACKQGRAASPPQDLAFAGMRSVMCRFDTDEGWTVILVLGQAWPRPEKDAGIAPINYVAALQTNATRFDEDTAALRDLLSTVRLFAPDQ